MSTGKGSWLREARHGRGWSAEELAVRARRFAAAAGDPIKLTQQSVSGYELGNAKREPRWLHYANLALSEGIEPEDIKIAPTVTESFDEQYDLVSVDEISLEFGMGATFLTDDVDVIRRWVPREWIEHFSKSAPHLLRFARGRGESMYPTILDGDLVLIDTGETHMTRQDEIWACGYGDLGGLKRLRGIGNGQVRIMSDNQQVRDEVVSVDELRIIGRVCGNLRRM